MKRKGLILSLSIGLALGFFCVSILAAVTLKVGAQFGNLKFAKTTAAADQAYLGLKQPGAFTLKDIQAPFVLIEILNSNCPHCIEQAAAMNRLFRLVEGSDLKDRLKFIGVVSNSEAAMNRWRTSYKVPFALVADPEWELATTLNITGTPTTVVVDKHGRVVVLHDGAFSDANKAFQQLKAKLK